MLLLVLAQERPEVARLLAVSATLFVPVVTVLPQSVVVVQVTLTLHLVRQVDLRSVVTVVRLLLRAIRLVAVVAVALLWVRALRALLVGDE